MTGRAVAPSVASSLRRSLLLRLGLSCWLAALAPGFAAAESEEDVKAAFLFNFARYVEWPDAAFANESAPIRLCLLTNGGFHDVLARTVSGRSVGRRPVEVQTIGALDAAEGCQLLFLGQGSSLAGSEVAAKLGARPVFTISDQAGFAAADGIANFILVDKKIRFEINPSAARRAGLKISSSLLRLAKLVGEGGT